MKKRNTKIIDRDTIGNIYGYCLVCNSKIYIRGRSTCCDKCSKELELRTKREKYGSSLGCDRESVSQKRKETCLKKYGVDNYTKTNEYLEKVKATSLSKYGVENFNQSELVKDKKRKTCQKKYNTENYAQTEECKNKIKETCLKKYGTLRHNQQHIKNYENYNKEYIINNFVENGYFDITSCAEYFGVTWYGIQEAKERFGLSEYKNKLYKGTSKAEEYLQEYFKNISNVKIKDRTILDGKEIDLVFNNQKLCVEYNGLFWHSELLLNKRGEDGVNYHLNKTNACESKGYTLFHIFDTDDLDIWKSMINNKLGLNNIVYARECIVKSLDSKECSLFLKENHLQGLCNSKIRYGLFYNNELVEVITFGKPRFNKNYDYELLRLCSKKYTTVVGGASKLFKHFLKQVGKCKIISYANRRFSKGEIYKTLGFTWLRNTKPNYFYFEHNNILSRNKCQKHKLKQLLGNNFDDSLSEVNNMLNNGYNRVFDCGNMVFEYINK